MESSREREKLVRSRDFWNAKAGENPFWYVSSYGPYDGRDLSGFWESGFKIWRDLQAALGYSPKATDVVVEIGCGVGRLTRAIAKDVGQVHAFDISAEMLRLAREADLPNASFHETDGASLRPVADSSADLVIAYCVFQHLPNLEVLRAYLAEMARVARPGATLAFTLSPRTWRDSIRPLMRARRWLKERAGSGGPRGLYKNEWIGIRPSTAQVQSLSSIALTRTELHGDKWLFFGSLPPPRR